MDIQTTPFQVEQFIKTHLAHGYSTSRIQTLLAEQKLDESQKTEVEHVFKALQLERRRRVGFVLVAVGAFLCVFGFLITLALLQMETNFTFALYGATGLGGFLLLGGLIAILG